MIINSKTKKIVRKKYICKIKSTSYWKLIKRWQINQLPYRHKKLKNKVLKNNHYNKFNSLHKVLNLSKVQIKMKARICKN